ncbi:MAG: YncE family protein [Gemmatimonadota bacterium]
MPLGSRWKNHGGPRHERRGARLKAARRFVPVAPLLLMSPLGGTGGGPVHSGVSLHSGRPLQEANTAGFRIVATLDVGANPHQISFGSGGETAYIAVAGSDRIAVVDAVSHTVRRYVEAPGTPLGVIPLPDGHSLAVTRFGADDIVRYDLESGTPVERLTTGGAPSLIVGPLPGNRYLISAEKVDRMWVLEADAFALERGYPTGRRPFPPGASSDGRVAFVPAYEDGSLTVVDLWNGRILDTVPVGEHPSGGAVLPEDIEYVAAVRGRNRLAVVNTASHRVVRTIAEGIGPSPFSVVVTPDGRLAFVNNTASHDISVLELPGGRPLVRLPVPEVPIVMAVHPSGTELWVSSEGEHRVTVIEIPAAWRGPPPAKAGPEPVAEVAVLGMIHGRHRTSELWGLARVEATIRRFRPDAVCAEIPPDRWERIWKDWTERRAIEDDRVKLFPEYTEVLLPLATELGFEVVPCAGWTREMSDLRNARIRQFRSDPAFASQREAYDRRLAAVRARYATPLGEVEDPRAIHSAAYDERQREELSLYDEYLNEWIGPGGWTNINRAHMRLIDRAIRTHRGQRLLITFGAGHKYWILDRLRERKDVKLLEVAPYLPR